jgi:hypothetical protein
VSEYAWLWAAIAAGAGLLIGQIGGRIVRRSIGHNKRDENTRASALAASRGVFWGASALGLAIAAGILDPDGLEEFGNLLRDGLPRILMGVVLAIVGYAVAMAVAQAVGQSAREATGVRQVAIKVSIFVVAVVVALVVAGVDHTMLVVVLVALVGAPAVALALLTARGAEGVATQISAGRALGHRFEEGWTLEVGELTGEVISMEPTFVEIIDKEGCRHQLPNAWLLERPYRAEPSI